MDKFRVSVKVTPRKGILDPQGKAVTDALHALGFSAVEDVHVGKYIVLEIQATGGDAARINVREMCERLLANPVTEDFDIVGVEVN